MTEVPDWAKPFLQENEYSTDWVWSQREIDDQLIGVAGISGTKYAYMEVHPVSVEQAKERVTSQVKALEQNKGEQEDETRNC